MPSGTATPPLTRQWVENAEIISKAMIRGVSYTSLAGVRAVAYPVSRTDRGVSWDPGTVGTGAGGLDACEAREGGPDAL